MTLDRQSVRRAAAARQMAAANPETSAWVSANAGSGKTRVLTDRVARLLLARVPPARILCITYTKAAATEMSGRLFATLGGWAIADDATLQTALEDLTGAPIEPEQLSAARRLFARALETPGGLKIETIHAFCQRILQAFPIEAGVVPGFNVIDERGAQALEGEARAVFFHRLQAEEDAQIAQAIDEFLALRGEHGFDKLVKEGLRARVALRKILSRFEQQGGLEFSVRKALLLQADETAALLEGACRHDVRMDQPALLEAAEQLLGGKTSDVKRGQAIHTFLRSPESNTAWADYQASFFTAENASPKKNLATKDVQKAHLNIEQVLEQEQDRLWAWEQKIKPARCADITIAAMRIISSLIALYEQKKTERGVLDYEDLIEKTVSLLRETGNAWVQYKLDGGIEHVLIDEAQDTSPDQWEIIRQLTDSFFSLEREVDNQRRTMFAVGDEKQSIYSFQGANPQWFARMRRYFSDQITLSGRLFHATQLEVSFRSVQAVLDVVDAAFQGEAPRAALTDEAEEVRHAAERLGETGYIELAPFLLRQKVDPNLHADWLAATGEQVQVPAERQLTRQVALRIRQWIDSGASLSKNSDGGGGKAIDSGDILILVRQRSAIFYEMIRALNEVRLPVAGADRMVLRDEAAFLDLEALARFCLLPEDDLALAEVLRGPFVGIDEDALFKLAYGRSGSLWNVLRGATGEEIQTHCAWLREAIKQAQCNRPFEFFKYCLDGPTPKRRIFQERLGVQAQDVIDEVLSLALTFEQDEPATLQGFLVFMRNNSDSLKRDMEEAGGRIRVMTVHGAKGLEAPVVFLIDTCAKPRVPSDAWLFDEAEGADDVAFVRLPRARRDSLTQNLTVAEAGRQFAEYQRLLYVAMTRARDRLYVAGVAPHSGRPEDCWHAMIERALRHMDGVVEIKTEGGTCLQYGSEATHDASHLPELPQQVSFEMPDWMRRPALQEVGRARRTPSGLLPSEADHLAVSPPKMTEGVDPFVRGRFIHKLLEIFPDIASEAQPAAMDKLLALAPYRALQGQRDEILSEVTAVLTNPNFLDVFGPGSVAEVAVTGEIVGAGGRRIIISGQIDRLLVREDQVLIVDFKSGQSTPVRAQDVPQAYIHQMAAYAELLKVALPGREIQAALLFTQGPKLWPVDVSGVDIQAITEA